MLELHVYGPYAGLPSIDATCLAAIAYLSITLPRNSYTVIASSNPHLSPSNSLPALRHNSTWLTSLPSIASYISQLPPSFHTTSPPTLSSPQDLAWTTHLLHHGQTLLDLSLFLSHPNFTSSIRPSFASILPFPTRYTLPLALRRAAESRCSSLPPSLITSLSSPPPPPPSNPIDAALAEPATTRSVLGAGTARIRLNEMVEDFLTPLERLLTAPGRDPNSRYLLGGDEPGMADCAALGVLSLLLFPELPDNWASEAVKRRTRLSGWVNYMRSLCFGDAVKSVEDVVRGEEGGKVPWGRVERGDWVWLGSVWKEVVGGIWNREVVVGEEVEDEEEEDMGELEREQRRREREGRRREWWKSVGMVAGGVVGFVGFVVWSGLVSIAGTSGEGEEEWEEEGEGEAGEGEEEQVGEWAEKPPSTNDMFAGLNVGAL